MITFVDTPLPATTRSGQPNLALPFGTTLDRFILREQSSFPFATGELSQLLRDIALASKVINLEINRAGLIDVTGAAGTDTIQGESQWLIFAATSSKAASTYLYPPTSKSPGGKLRLLYEYFPMAFIAEQAGGRATNGRQFTLDVDPTALHQRSVLFVGSPDLIDKLLPC